MIRLNESVESFITSVLKPGQYKKIEIKKISALPEEIEDRIKEVLKRWHPKKKECYDNAMKMLLSVPGVTFCEGVIQIMNGIPIEHAWNGYKGIYFDITSELLFGGNIASGEEEYWLVLETEDIEKAEKWATSTYGPINIKLRGQD